MTLIEGRKKVYELLDEYSSGGTITEDRDIDLKMNDFFDMAQKELARICRIEKIYPVEREEGVTDYAMPADFIKLKKIWRDGREYRGYTWRAGKLVIPESDAAAVEIEYYASPATIDAQTEGDYEFEINDNAAQALPFYVAAQQLIVDLVMDYSAPYNMWLAAKAELSSQTDGTEGRNVQNVLFGGRR